MRVAALAPAWTFPATAIWARAPRWLAVFRDASPVQGRDSANDADRRAGSTSGADAASHPADQFEAFFQSHEREIAGFLWRVTGDEQTANDLTQEVFLRAWSQFDKLRGYDRPEA